MCGIAGFIGPDALSPTQRKRRRSVVTALMMANTSRGTDAAGVAFVCPDGPEVVKGTGSAYGLVRRDEYAAGWHPGVATVIGHTRLATHGANSDQNAHPFVERTVTGVHNGMITNHTGFEKEAGKGWDTKAEVDSQVIFRLLARARFSKKDGLLLSYADKLSKLRGSMALVWVDQRDPDATYVFRHDNPLSMLVVRLAAGAFMSSEMPPLIAAVQAVYGDNWQQFTVAENTLFRFTYDQKQGVMYESVKVDMPSYYSGTYGGSWASDYRRWKDEDDDDATEIVELDCVLCGQAIYDMAAQGVERMSDGSATCEECTQWWKDNMVGTSDDNKLLALPQPKGEEVNAALLDEGHRQIALAFARAMGLTSEEADQFVEDIRTGKEDISPGEMAYLMDSGDAAAVAEDSALIGAERKN